MGYLRHTLLQYLRTASTKSRGQRCRSPFMNRQRIRIVAKRHPQSDCWLSVQVQQEWISGLHCTHRRGSKESRLHVTTDTYFVSFALSNIGGTSGWEVYVRLKETAKLLATYRANDVYTNAKDSRKCSQNRPLQKQWCPYSYSWEVAECNLSR